jgi:hypothetical protein
MEWGIAAAISVTNIAQLSPAPEHLKSSAKALTRSQTNLFPRLDNPMT